MNFDWQTEDHDWDDPEPKPAEPAPAGRSRWGWMGLVVVAFLALVAGGLIIYRQANNRVTEVEALLEEDILASHRLVHLAAAERDYELFVQVLSGRDPAWVAAQRELVRTGRLIDRRGLGLAHVPTPDQPTVRSLEISPDLTTAHLETAESYAIDVGNGLSETITLTQTVIYRLGPDSWLYAPPLTDAGGGWMVYEGRYLTLIYLESEAEIAGRLAFDLDTKLSEFCARTEGLSCPDDFHQRVRLSKDPESLLLNNNLAALSEHHLTDEIQLPAPRLVGMPVNEDGYRALMRGYAYHVIGGAFLQLVDYDCCTHSPFIMAVLEQLLADMALHPRPLYPAAYDALLAESIELNDPYVSWSLNLGGPRPESVRQAAAVVAFIRHTSPDIDLPQIAVAIQEEFSYWDFVREMTPAFPTDEEVKLAWLDFLIRRSSISTNELPYDLPEQDVVALCGLSNRSTTGRLFRYRPQERSWQAVETDLAFTNLFPAPGGETMALIFADNRMLTEPDLAFYSWENGQLVRRWQPAESGDLLYLYSVAEDSGQNLLISARSIGAAASGLYAFDMAACTIGECTPQVFNGIPVFAPDGEHVVVMLPTSPDGPEPLVYLAGPNGERLRELGPGRSPFWVDSERFGFVREGDSSTEEIVLGRLGEETIGTLISLAELVEAIPAENMPAATQTTDRRGEGTAAQDNLHFWIETVASPPDRPGLLFVAVASDNSPSVHLFKVHVQQEQPLWQFAYDRGSFTYPLPNLSFSPGGDWLVAPAFNMASNRGVLHLHHTDNGETETYPLYDTPYGLSWTADGRWLAKVDGDWLVLIAPGTDYQQVTIHDLPRCGPAGWVSR